MFKVAPKARFFWPVALTLLSADCATKRAVVENIGPAYVPHDVAGNVVRFTLAYNREAAMSLPIGDTGRPLLIGVTLIALGMLARIYWRAGAHDRALALATALIIGGAAGNLADRLRWERGVVDFIDVGIGLHRFWVFNVADIGISVGAALLALVLWRRQAADDAPLPLAQR